MVNCSSTVVLAVATAGLFVARTEGFSRSPPASSSSSSVLFLAEGRGDYYGESGSSFVIREFGAYDQLEGIVELTGRPLPERPDGIVCVAKYSSSLDPACVKTEAQYERLARDNPSTCFLRCFREYEDGDLLMGQAGVTALPTFDVFYGGNRVARISGSSSYTDLDKLLGMYQLQNTKLDLFSESADNSRRLEWGDGKIKSPMDTPRTTGRFIPGYDWDKDDGAFDDAASKYEDDFENTFGNWVPDTDYK